MNDIDHLLNVEASTSGARPAFVLPPSRTDMFVGEIIPIQFVATRVYTRMNDLAFSAQVTPHANLYGAVAYAVPPPLPPPPPDDGTEVGITNMVDLIISFYIYNVSDIIGGRC